VIETKKDEPKPLAEKPVLPKDLMPDDSEAGDMLEKEEERLREQEEEQHQEIKDEPHLHEGLPYETDAERKEHGHETVSDRDLLKVLKQKQEEPNSMQDFLDVKYKRKMTSLEASLLDALVEEDTDESRD
jgi:hypothetical protein